jgi:hypothetical protein
MEMEHPTLTTAEREIVERVTGGLGSQLLRAQIPSTRWPDVTLAVIAELAGQVLRLVARDTERAPPLCEHRWLAAPRADGGPSSYERCILPKGHSGRCLLEGEGK